MKNKSIFFFLFFFSYCSGMAQKLQKQCERTKGSGCLAVLPLIKIKKYAGQFSSLTTNEQNSLSVTALQERNKLLFYNGMQMVPTTLMCAASGALAYSDFLPETYGGAAVKGMATLGFYVFLFCVCGQGTRTGFISMLLSGFK